MLFRLSMLRRLDQAGDRPLCAVLPVTKSLPVDRTGRLHPRRRPCPRVHACLIWARRSWSSARSKVATAEYSPPSIRMTFPFWRGRMRVHIEAIRSCTCSRCVCWSAIERPRMGRGWRQGPNSTRGRGGNCRRLLSQWPGRECEMLRCGRRCAGI